MKHGSTRTLTVGDRTNADHHEIRVKVLESLKLRSGVRVCRVEHRREQRRIVEGLMQAGSVATNGCDIQTGSPDQAVRPCIRGIDTNGRSRRESIGIMKLAPLNRLPGKERAPRGCPCTPPLSFLTLAFRLLVAVMIHGPRDLIVELDLVAVAPVHAISQDPWHHVADGVVRVHV
jgi:hypothetical protein